ncbi:MAG: hypothetical protein M4579_002900 [Chaenotheca gracillima]|nr:MAG: hypothetical protein M4579_002900 [Chaenotheca gracillima]
METTGSRNGRREEGSPSKDFDAADGKLGADAGAKVESASVAAGTKEPSGFSKLITKLGLDVGTLLVMAKGALPPVIGLAMYQAEPIAKTYTTIGYLISIVALLSMCVLPRAKFLQTMVLNIIGICIGAAVALLALYSAVKARERTTPAGSVQRYNSSASAVCAVWLFFNIWIANSMRASRPQFTTPVILYSIFSNVAMIYGPQFMAVSQAIAFAKQLLVTFLTGMAIATGVSLFIIPMTSRKVVFKEATAYIDALRGVFRAQCAFLGSLETGDMFRLQTVTKSSETTDQGQEQATTDDLPNPKVLGAALSGSVKALVELHSKMHGDLAFAKREMAFGKLDADDLNELFKLFRGILFTVVGMGTVTDIFKRAASTLEQEQAEREEALKANPQLDPEDDARRTARQQERDQWNHIMQSLHGPLDSITQAIDEGLDHVAIRLELAPKAKTKPDSKLDGANGVSTTDADADVEAKGNTVKPGNDKFAAYLQGKIDEFFAVRATSVQEWCKMKGLDEPPNDDGSSSVEDAAEHERNRRQLYLILYMEHLVNCSAKSVLKVVEFADLKVAEGTMKKRRIIVPSLKRLRNWIRSVLSQESDNVDHDTPQGLEAGSLDVYIGALNSTKDPEHLPPNGPLERFGNIIRKIPHIIGSQESFFGLRVALATLTVGIAGYLAPTQLFFIEQRLVWAEIIISIGMTMTTGSSIFGFIGRIIGTAIAMVLSIVIYYIVDQKVAGILPFLWFFTCIEMYFLIKYPRFVAIALITMVTQVLIIGYELQVRKVGLKVASSNGQVFYPIYLLAPYRTYHVPINGSEHNSYDPGLACVAGGSLVAFFWTIFPYPITARSHLRRSLGASIYLLANFYSCVHTTVGLRLNSLEGDPNNKHSPGRRLEKYRLKLFAKELVLLLSLQEHSAFSVWEPSVGGKFPKETYDIIIEKVRNITYYMALISQATLSFEQKPSPNADTDTDFDPASTSQTPRTSTWISNLARLISSVDITSQEITSTLSMLSASVTSGRPLPPYLRPSPAYRLSEKLEELDRDILSVTHIAEPGYSAFAVMQVASSLIGNEMRQLTEQVKALVGEVDFSFHVISTADATTTTTSSGSTSETSSVATTAKEKEKEKTAENGIKRRKGRVGG